jgi:hypothetical protein
MKLKTGLLLLGFLAVVPAYAAVTITPSVYGTSSTMPGSPTDFTFFGNPTQFPSSGPDITANYESGVATQPTLLNDFQASVGANAQYTYGVQNDGITNYNSAYGSITTPSAIDGTQKTGILYSRSSGPQPDLVNFLLGGGSTFSYSNFDVFVMISNAPGSGLSDSAILANVYDATGAVDLASFTLGVTDIGSNPTGTAEFYEFSITGASAGDILELGATGANGSSAYLSGVSFKSNVVPEPSTWMMLGLGLAALAFQQRRRAKASV